ncbi:MAG: ClbS/DfsB family four-helix bundle protein, partial [Propionibacterium sp.]|nr:ClbS/DfsB family four-helix bundle protein [Propionibacterium sp.]
MAVPRTKDELLVAIADNYAKLSIDLGRVPASRAREASMPGHVAGTVMSPADLVSYLV